MIKTLLLPEQYWRKLDESKKAKGSRGRKVKSDTPLNKGSYFGGKLDKDKIEKRRRTNSAYLKKSNH